MSCLECSHIHSLSCGSALHISLSIEYYLVNRIHICIKIMISLYIPINILLMLVNNVCILYTFVSKTISLLGCDLWISKVILCVFDWCIHLVNHKPIWSWISEYCCMCITRHASYTLVFVHISNNFKMLPGVEFHDGNHGKCPGFFSLCRDAL